MGLLELLITSALVGVLLAMGSMIFASTVHHSTAVQEENITQTELRGAVERLTSDLRGASTGDDTTKPLESISSTAITFLSPDRATPYHLRRIAYRLVSGRFERAGEISSNTGGPPWTWPGLGSYTTRLRHVVNAGVFKYLDANGAETLNRDLARTVVVTLIVSPYTSHGRQYTYETSVTLRSEQ
jgi:type II secretory pathway component PulJ